MKELLRIFGLFLVLMAVLTSCTKDAFFPIDGVETMDVELRDGDGEDLLDGDDETETGDDGDEDSGDDPDGINDGDGDDDEEDDGDPTRSTE
jgi:hypothetical protein